jgi:signal peptidase I
MDFETLFSVLLLASGGVWLLDALVFKRHRNSSGAAAVTDPVIVQYARSFFPVLLVVLVIRSFIFEPFRIPSESMMPGLIDGDFIFVNKFSYGLRLPVVNTKILSTWQPERGDVIVFRLPSDPSVHFIKRLVGLPGDHVAVRNNQVFVNDAAVTQQPGGRFPGHDEFADSPLALETLSGRQHVIMFALHRPATDFNAVVPAGRYFFMGDNRNDSEDSRFPVVGFVPEGNLVGHAMRIGFNWRIPGWPDWHRIGMKIH